MILCVLDTNIISTVLTTCPTAQEGGSLTLIPQVRKQKSQDTRQQTKMWTVNQVSNCDSGTTAACSPRTVSASETEADWEPWEVNWHRRSRPGAGLGKCSQLSAVSRPVVGPENLLGSSFSSLPRTGGGGSECGLQSALGQLTLAKVWGPVRGVLLSMLPLPQLSQG